MKTKPINIFLNGQYVWTDCHYARCKDAKASIEKRGFVELCHVSNPTEKYHKLQKTDKILARFAKMA